MELIRLSWPQVDALSRDTPVVMPIGALEQHSHHLPLFTDALLVGEITRRVDAALADQILVAPVMWLGNSAHHLDFPGTLSASPRVYLDMLRDMIESLLVHGFKRFVLLNGHGGNTVPAQQALFEIRQKYRERNDLLLLLANYWAVGEDPRSTIPELTQDRIQHACQWETSMMLHVHRELVNDHTTLEPVDSGTPFTPAFRSSTTRDISQAGHVGDPGSASALIGKALCDLYTTDVTKLLQRVIDWDGRSWSG